MAGFGSFSMLDYNGEQSSFAVTTGDITATSLPGTLTQWGTLRTAIEGITLGTVSQEELAVFRTRLSNTKPADKNAQRERKWLIVYEDNTADWGVGIPNAGYKKVFTVEIPTADAALLTGRSDTIEADDPAIPAAVTDFITAFQALCKSPYGGTARVIKLVLVGRNL